MKTCIQYVHVLMYIVHVQYNRMHTQSICLIIKFYLSWNRSLAAVLLLFLFIHPRPFVSSLFFESTIQWNFYLYCDSCYWLYIHLLFNSGKYKKINVSDFICWNFLSFSSNILTKFRVLFSIYIVTIYLQCISMV